MALHPPTSDEEKKNEREMGEETEGNREMERKRKKKDWQKGRD